MKRALLIRFLLFVCLFSASNGFAKEIEKEILEASPFRAGKWTRGIHILASAGLNAFSLEFQEADPEQGIGGNFQSSVGYYFLNSYAIEAGSQVMLTRAYGSLIWETMLTIGARMRLPSLLGPDQSAPFLRVLYGQGPSVFILEDSSDLFEGDDRLHVEGDIFGLSYGFFQTTKSNFTWFFEANASVHVYRYLEYVVETDDVSDVYFSSELDGRDRMLTFSLGMGLVIF